MAFFLLQNFLILLPRFLLGERMRGVAEKDFGTFHHRLGERRMRMHGQGDVLGGRAHLHRQRGFGDQFARARPADAHANQTVNDEPLTRLVLPQVYANSAIEGFFFTKPVLAEVDFGCSTDSP